jgi:hypothetical protein
MPLPGDVQLNIQRAALTLTPALDGARLQLSLQVWTNVAPPSPLGGIALSGTLHVAGSAAYRPRFELCELTTEDLFTPVTAPTTVNLSGHVTDHALQVAEQKRAGGPLHLVFGLSRARWVAGSPPIQGESVAGEFVFELYADEWNTQLEKVTTASHLNLTIPITDDRDLQVAAGHIRTARTYIGDGDKKVNAVASELRQALDPVRETYRTKDLAKAARDKPTHERSKDERWALVVEARFSWLSAFEHDDHEAIKGCTMDRSEALDVLYEVAGKVQRLAVDRRAGLI